MTTIEEMTAFRNSQLVTPEKVKLLTDIPGTGKTTSAIEYVINNNKNNVVFFNNHKLTWDFSSDLFDPNKFKFKNKYNVINLFYGKYKHLTDIEQIIFSFANEYPCNMCTFNKLFNVMKLGFMPKNYCMNDCIYNKNCSYKNMINDNFNSAENAQKISDMNIINLMTKAHIRTPIHEKMFSMFKDIDVVMDENIFSLLYNQINLNSYSLNKYKKQVISIMNSNSSKLDDIWIDYSDIVTKIDDFTIGFKSIKPELKKQKIFDEIDQFLDSYTAEDIEEWNSTLSSLALRNADKLKIKSVNLTSQFISLIEDIANNRNNPDKIMNNMIIDMDDQTFSYIINKKDDIVNLINNSKSFILTSSVMDGNIFETILPEFKDNYKIIKKMSIKPTFKQVFRYTSGNYPKYVLWKYNQPTVHFFNLIKMTASIIKKHINNSFLILAFKDFIESPIFDPKLGDYVKLNYIEQELKKCLPDYNRLNITYDHWYGIEGLNRYDNIDIEIQFGSPGIPKKYMESMHNALGIDLITLDTVMIKGEQLQAGERLRSFKTPGVKIIYQLSKEINKYYPEYTDFNNIVESKYETLIEYIRKKGNTTTKQIHEEFYNTSVSLQQTNNILNELFESGIISKEKRDNNLNVWKKR